VKQFCFCLRTHVHAHAHVFFFHLSVIYIFPSFPSKGRKREEGLSSLDNKRIESFSEREEDPFFIDVDVGLAV